MSGTTIRSILAHRETGELRTVIEHEAAALERTGLWTHVVTEPTELAEYVPAPAAPVALVKVTPPKRKKQRRGTFAHPEAIPWADGMLDLLAKSDATRVGRYGVHSAKDVALIAECDIYNAWAEVQALARGLLPPGRLTPEQFSERYWGDDAPDRLDESEVP